MKARRILTGLGIFVLLFLLLPYLFPAQADGVDPGTLADAQGRFLTINEMRIYVREDGPQDGPALLLLHGLLGSTEVWRYNREALAAAGYRVIAFDRPPFGLSDKRPELDYSPAAQADLSAALLDELGIEQAVIIGHSAGGNVASHFALRHPERMHGLVLISAAVGYGGPPPFVGALLSFDPLTRWGRIGLRTFFTRERMEESIADLQDDASFLGPDDFEAYWRSFRAFGWDAGFIALTRDGGQSPLNIDALREVSAPVLLLHGTRDRVVPLENSEALAERFPNVTFMQMERLGHQPMEEAPAIFNAALLEWLDTLE